MTPQRHLHYRRSLHLLSEIEPLDASRALREVAEDMLLDRGRSQADTAACAQGAAATLSALADDGELGPAQARQLWRALIACGPATPAPGARPARSLSENERRRQLRRQPLDPAPRR